MERADKDLDIAATRDNLRPAMKADSRENMDLAGQVTRHHQRLTE